MKRIVTSIDGRLRTRLRVIIWKQWKKKSKRLSGLLKLGIPKRIADKDLAGVNTIIMAQRSVLKRDISKPVLENVDWFLTWFTNLNGMYHGVSGVRN